MLGSSFVGRLLYPLHYRQYIFESAGRYEVDPLFVAAVIRTESGFRSEAVSSEGALGLMQIMPTTASWVAEKLDYAAFNPEMLFQPSHNIEIGVWYLCDLFRQFGDNQAVVLAAYNAGRGEVALWLEKEIWDGRETTLERIPFAETRHFIRRALEAHRCYRQIYGTSFSCMLPVEKRKFSCAGGRAGEFDQSVNTKNRRYRAWGSPGRHNHRIGPNLFSGEALPPVPGRSLHGIVPVSAGRHYAFAAVSGCTSWPPFPLLSAELIVTLPSLVLPPLLLLSLRPNE